MDQTGTLCFISALNSKHISPAVFLGYAEQLSTFTPSCEHTQQFLSLSVIHCFIFTSLVGAVLLSHVARRTNDSNENTAVAVSTLLL